MLGAVLSEAQQRLAAQAEKYWQPMRNGVSNAEVSMAKLVPTDGQQNARWWPGKLPTYGHEFCPQCHGRLDRSRRLIEACG